MYSHHGFLVAVERDLLAGDAQFPTGLKVLAALRQVLDDPDAPVARVTALVSAEPLVTARLLQLANCATFNPAGLEIFTVEQAVQRVGFNMVRTAATAVAIAQMRALAGQPHMQAIADEAWQRSVRLSVLARLLAPGHAPVNADEAGLCALVSELGTFYLLQRAGHYPTYGDPSRQGTLHDLLGQHAAPITARLARILGMPPMISAVLDVWRQSPDVPQPVQPLLACMQQAVALLAPVFDPVAQGQGEPDARAFAPLTEAQAARLVHQAKAALADLLAALGAR